MIDWTSPDCQIPGTRFTVSDLIWQNKWDRMARPDELTEQIQRNLVGLAITFEKICREFNLEPIIRDKAHWSVFRTETYNKLVNGRSASAHVRGRALDVAFKNKTCDEVRDLLRLNLSRFCIRMEDMPGYSWLHIDTAGIGPFKV